MKRIVITVLSATILIIVSLPLSLISAALEMAVPMDVDPAPVAMTRLPAQSLVEKTTEFLIKKLYTDADGDTETIEAMIISLPIPEDLKASLAKNWYLNYGTDRNFILDELNYGFSIQELLAYHKLQAIVERGEEQKQLDLSFLRINDLTGLRSIPNINEVMELKLNHNRLSEVQPNTFNGLNKLKDLYLQNNQLTELLPNIFNGLNNLKALYLQSNQLTKLLPNAFNGLDSLEYLDLDYNHQLTELLPNSFSGLTNLRRLSLAYSQLTKLHPNAFNSLNNLKHLVLHHNQLTQLLPNAFNNLNNLKVLDLSYNQLTKLESNAFNGLNSLRHLYLSNNQLDSTQQEALSTYFKKQLPQIVVKFYWY